MVQLDLWLLCFLTVMWYATRLNLPVLEGTVSLRQYWQYFTIILYSSVFGAMMFAPSW